MAALRTRLAVALSVGALVALALVALSTHAHRASANPLTGIASVSAGDKSTCAVTTGGAVKCWGSSNGNIPVSIGGLSSGVATVAVGADHACALTTAGAVKCWGSNGAGQLGDGTNTSSAAPVNVVGLGSGVTAIRSGESHMCALTSSGGVKCWGDGSLGQLGNNAFSNSNVPVDVTGLSSGVGAIGLGALHSCSVNTAGGVKCWGNNLHGELGNGSFTDSATPVNIIGVTNASKVGPGATHSCATTTSGTVSCWGAGFGTTAVAVSGFSSVATIAGGEGVACAKSTAGGATCRGKNDLGQLGDGQNCGVQCNSPVGVNGLSSGVSVLSTGFRHSCAVTTTGGVKCWGWNAYGQLGDATTTDRTVPVDVVVSTAKPTSTNTPCPPSGCATATRTPTVPNGGIDFSIGIDTDGNGVDDCATGGGPGKCSVSSGSRFTLKVYLNSLPPPPFVGYQNFDIYVTYAGVSSKNNADTNSWPPCAYPARIFFSGSMRFGCSNGSGTSTYTGVLGVVDFNCLAAGSIMLVHGPSNTDIGDQDNNPQSEPQGSIETLTINCPTPTPTLSPTATRTPHPPPLGGVAEYPAGSSGPGAGLLIGLAAAIATLTLAGAGAWRLGRR